MVTKTIGFILGLLIAYFTLRIRFFKKKKKIFRLAYYIFWLTVGFNSLQYCDYWYSLIKYRNEVRHEFPSNLDFYYSKYVYFDSGVDFYYEDAKIKTDIKLTRIYQKNEKFYASFLMYVRDKENNTDWIDQAGEVELFERNIVTGKTDRLDFYFYVAKTTLGNANIYIGAKKANRGIVIKNSIIKGNAIRFN